MKNAQISCLLSANLPRLVISKTCIYLSGKNDNSLVIKLVKVFYLYYNNGWIMDYCSNNQWWRRRKRRCLKSLATTSIVQKRITSSVLTWSLCVWFVGREVIADLALPFGSSQDKTQKSGSTGFGCWEKLVYG